MRRSSAHWLLVAVLAGFVLVMLVLVGAYWLAFHFFPGTTIAMTAVLLLTGILSELAQCRKLKQRHGKGISQIIPLLQLSTLGEF